MFANDIVQWLVIHVVYERPAGNKAGLTWMEYA